MYKCLKFDKEKQNITESNWYGGILRQRKKVTLWMWLVCVSY